MNNYIIHAKFCNWFIEMMADKIGDDLSIEEALTVCLNEMGIFSEVKVEEVTTKGTEVQSYGREGCQKSD